jgi:hypothetical protein
MDSGGAAFDEVWAGGRASIRLWRLGSGGAAFDEVWAIGFGVSSEQ